MFKKPLTTLVVVLGLSTTAHAAQEALSPEQIFDLYARVLLNQDAASAQTLNDYMRPAYENQDHLDLDSMKQGFALIRSQMAEAILRDIPVKQRAAAKPSLEGLFESMQRRLKRSECKAVGSTVREREYENDKRVAEVNYRCTVSAATLDIASLRPQGESTRTFDVGRFNAAVRAMTERVDGETATRIIDGSATLFADAGVPRWVADDIGWLWFRVIGAFQAE